MKSEALNLSTYVPPSASPPRVLMVVPNYPYPVVGGLERQAHELAKALRAIGTDVQALSGMMPHGKTERENVEGVLVHRIPWSRRKGIRFLRTPFDLFRMLFSLRRTYDVIHLHQHSWFGLYTIMCARLLGKPILTKLPNVGDLGIPGLRKERLGRFKLALLLKSDALVSMSHVSHAELESVRFPTCRILSTPNGIRLGDRIRAPGGAQEWPSICRVVFVGRLELEKMLGTLLHSWLEVTRAAKTPAMLEFWGSGRLDAELKALSRELGLDEVVIFRGHVEGVREKLPSMDIFVLPSNNEGNSNAILEAMAAGLPIVSTRVGGTPMQVGQEGAEMLVEPGDQAALAHKLLTLIETPQLRVGLGAAMRRRIENSFDIQKVASTYAAAYTTLHARKPHEISKLSNPAVLSAGFLESETGFEPPRAVAFRS